MGLLDRFLDAIKLTDDDYDDDEFLDEDLDDYDDLDDEPVGKTKSRFFNRFSDDDDLDDDDLGPAPKPVKSPRQEKTAPAAKAARREKAPAKRSKVTPIRRKGTSSNGMEVNVIRPVSMEDTRDIADTLLQRCTVILNLEGLDVDMAQRIIDFTCGACYSVNGSLQKVSSYIFILTPENVDISGDFEDILSGTFDLPSMKASY